MHMSDRMRRLLVPLVALFIGLAVLVVAAVLTLRPVVQDARPSAVGGPFTLVSHEGKTVTERDFLGAPHLIFFGFTHCPDVCPTKLFEISEVLRATGEHGRRLCALFITVDPERDTPDALKSYLGSFDERIVGLTGDRAAIDRAIRTYRAYARKVPMNEGDYTMEHTALVYLMDKSGRFVSAFNLDRPPAQAAQELLQRL
jgi:protein SCO1/2